MSQAVSPSLGKPYGLARVCGVWKVPRSSVYAKRRCQEVAETPRRRGPRGPCSDEELAARIRAVLRESPWVGEGHRKVWARLRYEGLRVSRRRVLRVMREHALLAPMRARRERGPAVHDGSIVPELPDQRWGIDATSTLTGEGSATIFVLVDHCTAECLGIHAARRGTRFEALEPVRQAVRSSFGVFTEGVAGDARLKLRHDHGSQFVSHAFQEEIAFLGIDSSPAFVQAPEGNGCAERFIRTLKEQLLWRRRFETIEELLRALHEFRDRYNQGRLIERHGYVAPSEHRRRLLVSACEAA